jgi:signal transduction histidine kinase
MMSAREDERLVERIDEMLHDLCQPLTVIQCRLALGELNGEPAAMREAIGEALGACARMNHAVAAMRGVLIAASCENQ